MYTYDDAMKIAAYCRVSTEYEDQTNSFETQKRFFKEHIERNPDWELLFYFSFLCKFCLALSKTSPAESLIDITSASSSASDNFSSISKFSGSSCLPLRVCRNLCFKEYSCSGLIISLPLSIRLGIITIAIFNIKIRHHFT